jgi:hypothetical protein
MIFVPESVDIDGFDGGFAISFASLAIGLTAVVVGVMYLGWAGKLDKILRGAGIIATGITLLSTGQNTPKKSTRQKNPKRKGSFQ